MTTYRLIEETPEERARANDEWMREVEATRQRQENDHKAGIPALQRLFKIAQGDSGQCRRVAAFLLGLYNGTRFPFDLTDCRAVDAEIFDDMLLVLRMDSMLRQEVHTYFEHGGRDFERLAQDWNLYKREWEPTNNGFTRRRGAYRLDIEAVVQVDNSLAWTWTVSDWGKGGFVVSGGAWSPEGAKRAIDEWFEQGGESRDDE